uniref:Secreted protein n=1 Tax=Acrobeloides nanus TaxID=290746 RepID=A0A914E0B1_9BILA
MLIIFHLLTLCQVVIKVLAQIHACRRGLGPLLFYISTHKWTTLKTYTTILHNTFTQHSTDRRGFGPHISNSQPSSQHYIFLPSILNPRPLTFTQHSTDRRGFGPHISNSQPSSQHYIFLPSLHP